MIKYFTNTIYISNIRYIKVRGCLCVCNENSRFKIFLGRISTSPQTKFPLESFLFYVCFQNEIKSEWSNNPPPPLPISISTFLIQKQSI